MAVPLEAIDGLETLVIRSSPSISVFLEVAPAFITKKREEPPHISN